MVEPDAGGMRDTTMNEKTYIVNEQSVTIQSSEDGIIVNGKMVAAELLPHSNGQIRLVINDRIHVFDVQDKSQSRTILSQNGETFVVDNPLKVKEPLPKKTESKVETQVVNAPLPGVLVRYTVQPGELVAANTVVAIIESMKMQVEVRSKDSGKVNQLLLESGKQVESGQVLLTLE